MKCTKCAGINFVTLCEGLQYDNDLVQCRSCNKLYYRNQDTRKLVSFNWESNERKSDAKTVLLDEIGYNIAELGKSLNKVLCEISAGIGALTYKIDHLILNLLRGQCEHNAFINGYCTRCGFSHDFQTKMEKDKQ